MAYTNKEGHGALFKNEKRTSDNHPHYKGSFKGLDGVEYDIAAWLKEGKNGKFMSLKVSHQRAREDAPEQPKAEPAKADDLDDEIPF